MLGVKGISYYIYLLYLMLGVPENYEELEIYGYLLI